MDLENCIKYLLSNVIDCCFFSCVQTSQIFNMAHKTVSQIFFQVPMIFQIKEVMNINLRSHLYLSVEVT